MVVRARFCAPFALAGAMGGVLGGPAYAQTPSVYVQPAPIHQIQDGPDGASATYDAAPNELQPAVGPTGAVDAGPHVAIARRIVDAAGAFDGYMRRASAIKANFANGEAVARAVRLGSTYQAEQLEEGAIAYSALVALQDPNFVEAVHEVAEDPRSRDLFAARILGQPEAVLDAPAARRAITRVSAVLGRMGLQLVSAGAAVKQAAYDIQHQDWSKGAIVDPDKRLVRIKADSATPISLAPADTAHLFIGLTSLRETSEAQEADAATPVAMRGLAVAALAILGRAGDDQAQTIAPLLTDAKDAQCIKMARLNLNQCLAVAGPHYEDVFCLGRHAMMETGQCIASAAGVADEDVRPAMDTTSVLVPVAFGGAAPVSGPERETAFGRTPAVSQDDVGVPLAAVAPTAVNYSPYTGPAQP